MIGPPYYYQMNGKELAAIAAAGALPAVRLDDQDWKTGACSNKPAQTTGRRTAE